MERIHPVRLYLSFFLCLIYMSSCAGGGGGVNSFIADLTGTVSTDSLDLEGGGTKTVADQAEVTVTGETEIIDGTLDFLGGATLIFENDVVINGTLKASDQSGSGILPPRVFGDVNTKIVNIIVKKNLTIGPSALITTKGLRIVSSEADLKNETVLETDTETDDGAPNFFSPTLDPSAPNPNPVMPFLNSAKETLPQHYAQAAPMQWVIRGTFNFETPNEGRLIFQIWPGSATNVDFENLTVVAPPAISAPSASGTGIVTGTQGPRGMTMNVKVPGNVTFNNVTLNLGDGGTGGSATATGIPDATATGGKGGDPGNLKITSTGTFELLGLLTVNPGKGGTGGSGTANGGTGLSACQPTAGGAATATGGAGGEGNKLLRTRNLTGLTNLDIGPVLGGSGGDATANAGVGGQSTCCPSGKGANGGIGTATGGAGADASLAGVVAPVTVGQIRGGDGGDGIIENGLGGVGANCQKQAAGDGGDGGNLTAFGGVMGLGTSINGFGGIGILGSNVSAGGRGGSGLPVGNGGLGGSINLDGSILSGSNGSNGLLPILEKYCIELYNSFSAVPDVGESFEAAPPASITSFFDVDALFDFFPVVATTVPVKINGGTFKTSAASDPEPHIGIKNGQFEVDVSSFAISGVPALVVGSEVFPKGTTTCDTDITPVTAGGPQAGSKQTILSGTSSFQEIIFGGLVGSLTGMIIEPTVVDCYLLLEYFCIIDP